MVFHSRRNCHRLFYRWIAKIFAPLHFHLLCDFFGRYPGRRFDLFPRRCPYQYGEIFLPHCGYRYVVDWYFSMVRGKISHRIDGSNRQTTGGACPEPNQGAIPNPAARQHSLVVFGLFDDARHTETPAKLRWKKTTPIRFGKGATPCKTADSATRRRTRGKHKRHCCENRKCTFSKRFALGVELRNSHRLKMDRTERNPHRKNHVARGNQRLANDPQPNRRQPFHWRAL